MAGVIELRGSECRLCSQTEGPDSLSADLCEQRHIAQLLWAFFLLGGMG